MAHSLKKQMLNKMFHDAKFIRKVKYILLGGTKNYIPNCTIMPRLLDEDVLLFINKPLKQREYYYGKSICR